MSLIFFHKLPKACLFPAFCYLECVFVVAVSDNQSILNSSASSCSLPVIVLLVYSSHCLLHHLAFGDQNRRHVKGRRDLTEGNGSYNTIRKKI